MTLTHRRLYENKKEGRLALFLCAKLTFYLGMKTDAEDAPGAAVAEEL
jgi:hypothetical protein